jgi:hypothetical protein
MIQQRRSCAIGLTLKKNEETILYPSLQTRKIDLGQLPKETIPPGAREFYHDFGPFIHSYTHEPVLDLTDYQYEIWDDPSKYRMVVKSQKVGLSTSTLLEDFHKALTVCRGTDILLIAQSIQHAIEHLRTLKRLVRGSDKYRKYLIERETVAKAAYIRNPDSDNQPTRIIALGMNEGMVWSWKNVSHIHVSDPTVTNIVDDAPLFAGIFSRLANTEGTMIIETPPRGPRGKVFEIYQQSLLLSKQKRPDEKEAEERKFKIFHVTADQAVHEGLITQQFLNEEKSRLGALYPQYYEAQFIAVSGNLFNQASIDQCLKMPYSVEQFNPRTEKYITVDVGYKTSKFGIIVAEVVQPAGRIQILKAEEMAMPKYEDMLDRIMRYRQEYDNVVNIAVDATSNWEFVVSLKDKIGESSNISHIEERMRYAKKNGLNINRMMSVVPILFNTESKSFMSDHARRILDHPYHYVAIDQRFVPLITGLRSAVFDDRGQLDKEMSPHHDLTDCFQMLLMFFHWDNM